MRSQATIHFTGAPGAPMPRGVLTSLPGDLLASASSRLAWASLMYGTGFLAVYVLFSLTDPAFVRRETFVAEAVAVSVSSLFAFAVFAVARTRRLRPESLLDLGLLFEVFGGLGISFVEHWALFGARPFDGFGISWICVWIVIFPLIVPSTPGKAFLAALVTASTGILAFTVSIAANQSPMQPFEVWVRLFGPSYVSTLLALLAAKVVYKLGTDVKEARRMGAYELVELLGRGGMGEVWRARHRFLSRPAAIKLISPGTLDLRGGGLHVREIQRRFEREAQATASLNSPHSILLYDFGTTETGGFYYVMELLQGVDLQEMVERFGPVSAGRSVYLLKQACHSLMDAHTSGLIHRDIKPANIYLCRKGLEADYVKVLDFGLVKQERRVPDAVAATTSGVISGTPGYMAPEIILGSREVDARCDIYSLGCVAYWLLTGHLVFEEETQEALFRSHVTRDPLPPSRRTEQEIPATLDELVLRCLARSRKERIQSAAELLEGLEDLAGSTAWGNRDAVRWWNRHLPRTAPAPDTVPFPSGDLPRMGSGRGREGPVHPV